MAKKWFYKAPIDGTCSLCENKGSRYTSTNLQGKSSTTAFLNVYTTKTSYTSSPGKSILLCESCCGRLYSKMMLRRILLITAYVALFVFLLFAPGALKPLWFSLIGWTIIVGGFIPLFFLSLRMFIAKDDIYRRGMEVADWLNENNYKAEKLV